MIIKINDVNVSGKTLANTFSLVKSSNYQQECTFTLNLPDEFRSGMEIVITEDDETTIIFGGLIQEPKRKMISSVVVNQTIKATGYRQILSRRSFDVIVDNQKAGVVVKRYFDEFLSVDSPLGEELILGSIEEGINIPTKNGVFSASELYNDLAIASGLSWWIDDTKTFYFASKPIYTDITRKLTDDSDEIESIDTFVCNYYPDYKEDLSNYRNKQFVIGVDLAGEEIIGQAENTAEIDRMKLLYGSGVYGNILKNDNIRTLEDANSAAQAELNAYSDYPATITFETTDEVDVNQRMVVKLSKHNIDNALFTVERVTIKFNQTSAKLVRVVQLKKHFENAKAIRTWTEDFDIGLGKRGNVGDSLKMIIFNSTFNEDTVVVGQIPIALPGIDVEFLASSKVAYDVQINATSTETTNITMAARIGEVDKRYTYKHYSGAYLDQIIFNGLFDSIAPTTAVVDFTIVCDSGTLTILPNNYHARFTIEGGGAEEATPAPVINITDIVTSFVLDSSQEIIVSGVSDSILFNTQTPTTEVISETVTTITLDSNQLTVSTVTDSINITIT